MTIPGLESNDDRSAADSTNHGRNCSTMTALNTGRTQTAQGWRINGRTRREERSMCETMLENRWQKMVELRGSWLGKSWLRIDPLSERTERLFIKLIGFPCMFFHDVMAVFHGHAFGPQANALERVLVAQSSFLSGMGRSSNMARLGQSCGRKAPENKPICLPVC